MHDIICPNCGESFIARDVAFDFSEYILPLISPKPDTVANLKNMSDFLFEYFIDEEDIISAKKVGQNNVRLETEEALGPGHDRNKYYSFEITNVDVFKYIINKNGFDYSTFAQIIEQIDKSMQDNTPIPNEPKITESIKRIYSRCFTSVTSFDMTSPASKGLLDILCHIYKNQEMSIELFVRMYCSKLNKKRDDYYVPDVMFVLNNSGNMERKKKSCRCCGHKFPDEFGYFKMIPITMLGSAYAGKTSAMLSLLWCTMNRSPFNKASEHFKVSTLTDDDNLRAFQENIDKYEAGFPANKTAFRGNVPILSFLVNDVIYTFIDWPGEAFIYAADEGSSEKRDYAYDVRRVIQKSRHFICSLDPSQVVPELGRDHEEDNKFSETLLMNRFKEHIRLAPERYLRSVIFLANKFDLYADDVNSQELNKLLDGLAESNIYSDNGRWDYENWNNVTSKTASFLQMKIPAFVTSVSTEYAKHNVCFIPAAPYGRTTKRPMEGAEGEAGTFNDRAIKKGYMNGLAFLHILRSDGVIK